MANGLQTPIGRFTKGLLGGIEFGAGVKKARATTQETEELQFSRDLKNVENLTKTYDTKPTDASKQAYAQRILASPNIPQQVKDSFQFHTESDEISQKQLKQGITKFKTAKNQGEKDEAIADLVSTFGPEHPTVKFYTEQRQQRVKTQAGEALEILTTDLPAIQQKLTAGQPLTDEELDVWNRREELERQTFVDPTARGELLKARGIGIKPTRNIKTVPDETSSTGFVFRDVVTGETFAEAPKPSSLVKIDLPKPISPSERTAIAEGEAAIDSLNNIGSLFDEAFVGPVAGRVGTTGELFGLNPEKQSQFIAATAAFKNQIIKEITGAQMSEIEARRILKQVPDENNPPTVWKARWEQSIRNIERLQKRRIEILRRTFKEKPESDLSTLSDEELLKRLGGE
jgi:hypothetical protein